MTTADTPGFSLPIRLTWAVVAVLGLVWSVPAGPGAAVEMDQLATRGPAPAETPASPSHIQAPIPEEPSEYDAREIEAFYDWRNDMFFRRFDMSGGGKADFMTARRTYKVWTNDFGNPVALTMANPLFYWVDLDADGEFEPNRGEMWSDPEEDGVNGNEHLYDVPQSRTSRPPAYPFGPRSRPR